MIKGFTDTGPNYAQDNPQAHTCTALGLYAVSLALYPSQDNTLPDQLPLERR